MKRILLIASLLCALETPVYAAGSQLVDLASQGTTKETAKSLWSAITVDAKTIWHQRNNPSQIAAWSKDPVTQAVAQKFKNAATTDAKAFAKAADNFGRENAKYVPYVGALASLLVAGMGAKGLYKFAKEEKTAKSYFQLIPHAFMFGLGVAVLPLMVMESIKLQSK